MLNDNRIFQRTTQNKCTEQKNGWWGATPSTWNFGSIGPRWSEIADSERILARSASAVTPIAKKNLIDTNRKSTTRSPMSQDEHRTLSLSPPPPKEGGGLKNAVFEIYTISCDNSETVRDRRSVRLLLIT